MDENAEQDLLKWERLFIHLLLLLFFITSPSIAAPASSSTQAPASAALPVKTLEADAADAPEKQYEVGLMYAAGIEGGKANHKKARQWFEKAAAASYPPAMHVLAILDIEGLGAKRDYASAYRWAERLAGTGDASGYMLMAMLRESGAGVQQDFSKAIEYYGYASRQSHDIGALYRLGMINLHGRGVRPDAYRAARWLEAAALKEDSHAQYQLGKLFYEGIGVKQDYEKAIYWFEHCLNSREKGISASHVIFGKAAVKGKEYTHQMGRLMQKDPEIYKNAALFLGNIYADKSRLIADPDKAKLFYARAADEGSDEAKRKLASYERDEQSALIASRLSTENLLELHEVSLIEVSPVEAILREQVQEVLRHESGNKLLLNQEEQVAG